MTEFLFSIKWLVGFSIKSIVIDLTNTQIIYVGGDYCATTDGIFKSIDGGNTYVNINSGFKDYPGSDLSFECIDMDLKNS